MTKSENKSIIELQGVTLCNAMDKVILERSSFTISAQSFITLWGLSNSGKTEFLRMLTLEKPYRSGTLKLFGQTVDLSDESQKASLRQRIGIISQTPKFLDHLSVYENLILALTIQHKLTPKACKEANELLDWFNLQDVSKLPTSLLHAYQRRLLDIARAIITNPDLILADSAIADLEPRLKTKIMHLFTSLNDHSTTILMTSRKPLSGAQQNLQHIYINNGQLTFREKPLAA